MDQEINVLALVKGNERYVFIYSDDNRNEAVRRMGRFASNRELSFSWYDAAVLSQKVRRQIQHDHLVHKNACSNSEPIQKQSTSAIEEQFPRS